MLFSLFSSLVALLLSSMLGCVASCDLGMDTCGAHLPGDVIIGVLMPCHAKVDRLHNRAQPDRFTCTSFDLGPFVRSLAIIHTIEEINASGFLPGVRLGYLMCDTCSDATKALRNVERMLAVNGSLSIQCDYTEFRPPVKVIVGARYSEVSIAVAKLLGAYMVPQISCSSSSPALSDKLRYPSFLRTVPSDVHQTKAIAKLMARFKWNWVGVVYGDDDYGKAAFQSFLQDAEEMNVCTAYQEMVPHYLDHEHSMLRIKQVAEKIRSSGAQVVLLILKGKLVEDLFKVMIQNNITRTWIASDAWSRDRPLAHMDGINQVGDILGFTFVARPKETFSDYLRNMTASPGGYNNFIKQYKNLRFNCTPECFVKEPPSYCPTPDLLKIKSAACSYTNYLDANDDFLTKAVDTSQSYNDVVGVWAIANALKSLLKCNKTSCRGEINFQPWKLLAELKRIHFTLDNQSYFFDKNGDFVNGYDMIMWDKIGDRRFFRRIGRYHALDGRIELVGDVSNINWLSTANNLIPESRCSESCRPGFVRKILNVSCCYDCISCVEGTYSNGFDLNDCQKCPNGTSSEKEWDHCEPIVRTYMRWSDPYPIALVVSAAFGELLLLVIFIIFLVHRNSPPMKRAEVRISCTMMGGLAVSFASVICFIDKPTLHLCWARQIMYAMGFTLCVSCILVKAYRTFLAFLPFGQLRHKQLNKLYRPPLIISLLTAIQGVICILWMVFDRPDVDYITPSPQSLEIRIMCHVGKSFLGFGIMLSYIALLALVGFLLAFKGRGVPQEFCETGYIIFSMLMYLFVWVCFIPVYIVKTEDACRCTVQASAILVSSYGVIFCHFLPKCFEALFKPQVDTLQRNLKRWTVNTARPSVPIPISIPNPDLDRDTENTNTGPPTVSQRTPSLNGSISSGYYSASLSSSPDASPASTASPVFTFQNTDLERGPENPNTGLETVSQGTPIPSASTERSGYHTASVRLGTLGDARPARSEAPTDTQVRKRLVRTRSVSF